MYAKATHNNWAMLLSDGGPLKNDDGEVRAGMVILRMLEREQLFDHVIVVTRWFGGTSWVAIDFDEFKISVAYYLEHRQ